MAIIFHNFISRWHHWWQERLTLKRLKLILQPDMKLLFDTILLEEDDGALHRHCYDTLFTAFEAGNRFYASRRTREVADQALEFIIQLSKLLKERDPTNLAGLYLGTCYTSGRDGNTRPLRFNSYKRILREYGSRRYGETVPPPPSPVSVAQNAQGPAKTQEPAETQGPATISTLFNQAYKPQLNLPPQELFEIVMNSKAHYQRRLRAFKEILYLFERRNSDPSITADDREISADALDYIREIAQAPRQTPFAWQALLYIDFCYHTKSNGAGHPLDHTTRRELELLLDSIGMCLAPFIGPKPP